VGAGDGGSAGKGGGVGGAAPSYEQAKKWRGQKMKDTRGNCLNFVLGLLFSALHFFAFFLAKYPQARLSSISSSSDPYH
jgi:hypothetical protein